MGYDPNYEPSPRWFGGRAHLKIARDALEKAEAAENPRLAEFAQLYLARLEMQRAIRAIVGLPLYWTTPPPDDAPELSSKLWAELVAAWDASFVVRYGGNNQYGVPNYFFTKGEITASLTGSGEQSIIKEAFDERLAAGHSLMRLTIRAFGEIYLEEKAHDLFYNDPFENYSAEEAFEELQRMGAVKSAVETSQRFGGDFYKALEDPEIAEGFRKWQTGYWLRYHSNGFWGFDELDAIRYSHASR